MSINSVYAFVFKGLLSEEALDKSGRKTKKNFSEVWETNMANRLGISSLDDELVAKSRRMSIVYIAICAFENSVREFIEKKLLEEKGSAWWSNCVKPEIKTKAENRKKLEKDVRWLTPRGNSFIYYTEFGDLVSIIAGNWTLFEVHMQSIDWVKHIITTLEKSRNVIMHSGELDEADIERIGIYIKDWIKQLG